MLVLDLMLFIIFEILIEKLIFMRKINKLIKKIKNWLVLDVDVEVRESNSWSLEVIYEGVCFIEMLVMVFCFVFFCYGLLENIW